MGIHQHHSTLNEIGLDLADWSQHLHAGKHGLSKAGITYGGLHFDGSKDGTAQGIQAEEVVECRWSRGNKSSSHRETSSRIVFSVLVPPLSAVILKLTD